MERGHEDLPSQEELSDQLRARALMDTVLSEMPSELREVFVLFELEELPVAEVAGALVDSPGHRWLAFATRTR